MRKLPSIKPILVVLFLTLEIFFYAGCGSESRSPFAPSAPETPAGISFSKKGSGGGNTPPDSSSTLLLVRRREENENGVSTAIIGPAGGTLVHADHQLIIPPGALNDFVEISFSMPVSDTLMFELGPHGLQFNAPISAVFSYDHAYTGGLAEDHFTVAVWNPVTGAWDGLPSTVDTELNLVTGSTAHFSRYAISK